MGYPYSRREFLRLCGNLTVSSTALGLISCNHVGGSFASTNNSASSSLIPNNPEEVVGADGKPLPKGEGLLQIEMNRNKGIAPAGIIFKAKASGFNSQRPFQELRYKWSFGDPGFFRRLDSEMPWGTDHNIAYGPVAAHTYFPKADDFKAAGSDFISFEVVCTATDGVSVVTAREWVTIQNPDSAFPGRDTLVVMGSGDAAAAERLFPGCQKFRSTDEMLAALDRKENQRILFERGFTYTGPGVVSGINFQIGSYGSGEYPILTDVGIDIPREVNGTDIAIFEVDQRASYDPSIPNDQNVDLAIRLRGEAETGRYTTIHDTSAIGFRFGLRIDPRRLNNVISDHYATNWFDFGIFQPDSGWIAVIGTTMQQNPLARNGGGKYDTDYAVHGPIRLSRVKGETPVVINNCDFASFTSWGLGNNYLVQSPLRLNNGGSPGLPEISVTQLRASGGTIGLPATNGYSASFPVKAVLDKIYHLQWDQSRTQINIDFGGVRVSNVITVEPDTPDWSFRSVIGAGPGGYEDVGDYRENHPEYLGYPDRNGEIKYPQEFLGITVVKLVKPENLRNSKELELVKRVSNSLYPSQYDTRNEASVVTGGILIHAPAYGYTAPVDLSPAFSQYAALPQGALLEMQPLDTRYAVSLNALSKYTPTRPIPAKQGEKMPIDDFYGTIRGENPTSGAIEYTGG